MNFTTESSRDFGLAAAAPSAPLRRTWRGRIGRRLLGWRDFWFDRATLPADVRDEEVTVVVCFRLSVEINRLLGDTDEKTLSAMLHERRVSARGRWRFLVWNGLEGAVDLACAVLRGEAHHCEAAYQNYRARPSLGQDRGSAGHPSR